MTKDKFEFINSAVRRRLRTDGLPYPSRGDIKFVVATNQAILQLISDNADLNLIIDRIAQAFVQELNYSRGEDVGPYSYGATPFGQND